MPQGRKLIVFGCLSALPLLAWFAFSKAWAHSFDTFPELLKSLIGCSILLSPLWAIGALVGVICYARSYSRYPLIAIVGMCHFAVLAVGYCYVTYEFVDAIANFPGQQHS